MNRILIFFALLFSYSVSSLSAINPTYPPIKVPMEFTIRERSFSFTSTFDVETANERIGTITKKFISLTPQFNFFSPNDELIASAKARFFSWGTTADVFDDREQPLGWIEEEFTLFSPCKYRVFSRDNRLVAMAKMNFWGTKFSIKNPNENEHDVAVITRPWFSWLSDKWTVKVLDPSSISAEEIDPRLLIMMAVYRTNSENAQKRQRQIENAFQKIGPQQTQLMLQDTFASTAEWEEAFFARVEELEHKLRSYEFPDSEIALEVLENDLHIARFEKQDDEVFHHCFKSEEPISETALARIRVEREAACLINTLEKGIELLEDPTLEIAYKKEVQRLLLQMAETRAR